jgi:S-DNA-T family DNA segregation ATPase FtsK/SpoIIIE
MSCDSAPALPPLTLRLTVRVGAEDHDIELTAPSDTALAELEPLLRGHTGLGADARLTIEGRRPPSNTRLADGWLRSGAILSLGQPEHPTDGGRSVWQLHVSAGPDAGARIPVGRGDLIIGRGPEATVRIRDSDLSRKHARLAVRHDGLWLTDLASRNGTVVDGSPLRDAERAISGESVIRVGRSELTIAAATDPPAIVADRGDGHFAVTPALPRAPQPIPATVELPGDPASAAHAAFPWLAALLPALLSVGLALALHNRQLLLFSVVSPLCILASAIADRVGLRRSASAARAEHAKRLAEASRQLREHRHEDARRRRQDAPNPAAVAAIVDGPSHRLWERRWGQLDFLLVRLGTASLPARVGSRLGSEPPRHENQPDLPVLVSLAAGPLGIAGPAALARGCARSALAQIIALHAPSELQLRVLLDEDDSEWRWIRWLPSDSIRLATTAETRLALIAELLAERRERRARQTLDSQAHGDPWLLVVHDASAAGAEELHLAELLRDAAGLRITALLVARRHSASSSICRSLADFVGQGESGRLTVVPAGGRAVEGVTADGVSQRWAESLARRMAPLRDANSAQSTGIPSNVALADLLPGPDPFHPTTLARSWSSDSPFEAVIGLGTSGIVTIDLRRDGPHALVAGTTGSGKSEFLRTLIASLAARHPPDRLAFVLIDYKGGAAFAECQELPHVTGVATDLDGHRTDRVLQSLEAELLRREVAFLAAAVTDLDGYWSTRQQRADPLPRLVVIIDEFAAVNDGSTFVSSLVSVATRGRSLGLHLVLATQRPAGVVSPQIKANLGLRVGLRVNDDAESIDIVGTPAAARIKTAFPGRAIAVLADGLVEFQAARVDVRAKSLAVSRSITLRRLDDWNRPQAAADDLSDQVVGTQPTDLARLVAAAQEAARLAGRAAPRRCWLPPLPTVLPVATLRASVTTSTDDESDPTLPHDADRIPLALIDDPAHQKQPRIEHSLARGGGLGFVGSARSGRSTGLRTLLATAARQQPPSRLHLQVIDCAGGALAPLAQLPHCRSMVSTRDPDVVVRLIQRLVTEWRRRQRVIAHVGADSVLEAAELGVPLPWIVLAVDGWEDLVELSEQHNGGRSSEDVLMLARAGAAAGFTVAISGDRSVLSSRSLSALQRVFLLPLVERTDYLLAGVSPALVPTTSGPGRCVVLPEQLQGQLAVLGEDASPAGQREAISAQASQSTAVSSPIHDGHRSSSADGVSVRPLPRLVDRSSVPPAQRPSPTALLLGLGGDAGQPAWVDLFDADRRFLIAGPPRSGRSTAALTLAEGAHELGALCLVIAKSESPLREWAAARGQPLSNPDSAPPHGSRWPGGAASRDHGEADDGQRGCGLRLILIDDAEECDERWEDFVSAPNPVGTAIVAVARTAEALVSYRGLISRLQRSHTGLLLQPGIFDGELLGVANDGRRSLALPGRGLLVASTSAGLDRDALSDDVKSVGANEAVLVQVAAPPTDLSPPSARAR